VGAGRRRNPTVNANLVLGVELAGAKPEDVDITLGDNGLTISRERKAEEKLGDYYISERRYGSFSRSLTLPQGIEIRASSTSALRTRRLGGND
jgi:HSP20 family protein